MQEGSFSRVIADHLELQRRNSRLERALPLDHYREQFDRGSAAAEPPLPPSSDPPIETADALVEDSSPGTVETPWDDPDSWWNVRDEPTFNWNK
jgi:hypothetical protein